MANDNIFQQYLAPPKSVMEYSAELDQADVRKQALQQNALELAAGRQKFDEGQQASQRAAQLRTALMGLPQGATDDQRIQAMRGTATPEGFAAADALSKSLIEQRKGTAAAAKDEAETAKTNLARDAALHDFHAQKLATVQSPEDALAWAQEGQALGLFKQPGQYERGVAAIQQAAQDPQTFAKWKVAAMQGGQSVTEQLKQQLEAAKQAEQVRQFGVTDQRIKSEGDANRANQIKVQQMITDRAESDDGSGLSDATKKRIAVQFVDAGDTSGMKNVGRGSQGAKDLRGIQNAITDYASSKGMSPTEISAKIADFEGLKNGLRTSANISARVENAISEAKELAPLAIAAGREVSRSGVLPFGKLGVMFNTQTNDPALKKFATANNGLVTAYAGAMARGQKPTQASFDHAQHLLSEAQDQASYEAAVNQLYAEMDAASRAPQNVRAHLRDQISGNGTHGSAPAGSSSTPPKLGDAKPSLSDIFGH